MLVLSFFILLLIIFLGLTFSRIKIVVKKLDFAFKENNKIKSNYDIKLGLYLFGKIKIIGLTLKENYISFLGFKISFYDVYKKIIKPEAVKLDKDVIKGNIKLVDMKFEKINLNAKIGTDSTLITSFLTFAVSTIVSFIIQKGVTKYNAKKHKFIITPVYEEKNSLEVYLDMNISLKTKNIIKVLSNLHRLSKTEHNNHKMKLKLKEIKI